MWIKGFGPISPVAISSIS